MDGARAAPARRRRARRPADDRQRGGAARGDARGARRVLRGAGRRARPAALADSDPVAVSERGLRARDGERPWRARSPKGSRTSRSAICSSRTSGATARSGSPAPGSTPLFPLFGADTRALAREMIAGGLRARITCVEPDGARSRRSPAASSMRRCSPICRATVDPCGERGEFHTCAYDGPMFSRPIPIDTGIVVERDGFVFADLTQSISDRSPDDPIDPITRSPDEPLSRTHRLPDRRNDRDAVPARPGRSRRRRVRLHRAAAGSAPEAARCRRSSTRGSTRSRRSSRIWCSPSPICRPISPPSWSGAASPSSPSTSGRSPRSCR